MQAEEFVRLLGSDFYTGVPDSQLKPLCNYLMEHYGIDKRHHIIAANEGNAVALAAGYYLATGKVPVVYMQNSGEGNIVNPVTSLLHPDVYAIPMIFIVGWRGEPGTKDEPQHIFQGKITRKLLEDLEIPNFVIHKNTDKKDVSAAVDSFQPYLQEGKQVAFIIGKGGLKYPSSLSYTNHHILRREEIIQHIVKIADKDPIISTTGKASRELFEIREVNDDSHAPDFLTVGSMGHSSSIALGIALHQPDKKIWCLDGDGAALMHMGAMALIGANKPDHFVHIIINNGAHESVGGMPTVAGQIDFIAIAKGCGYPHALRVSARDELDDALRLAKSSNELIFIEIMCAIGARKDLGRPTLTTSENKKNFMEYLSR